MVPFSVGGGTITHSSSDIVARVLLLLLGKWFGIISQSSSGMVIIALFMHSMIFSSSFGGSNETVSK